MIIGVIGKPRMGKTLFITMMGLFDLEGYNPVLHMIQKYAQYEKRKIYANYPLSIEYTPYNMDDILSIKNLKVDLEPKTFLMQEAGKWFDSRKSMTPQNMDLINFTGQSGKRETNLYYDDQFITRIDKGLRDVTEFSYLAFCKRTTMGEPFLFEYEEYGGYFQYATGRTIKLPAVFMEQYYTMYDTRTPTVRG